MPSNTGNSGEQDTRRLRAEIFERCPRRNGKHDLKWLVDQLAGHNFGIYAGRGRTTIANALDMDNTDPVPGQFLVVFEHLVPGSISALLPLYGSGKARGMSRADIERKVAGLPQSCSLCQERRRHSGTDGRPAPGLETIAGRGDLYVVLGTSGLRVAPALEATSTTERRRHVVKLEDHLNAEPGALPGCLTALSSEIPTKGPIPLRRLLTLPFPLLCRLWRDALASAMEKVDELLETGDVYFTFHGVWFNNENNDQSYAYMSCVDMVALKTAVERRRANRCIVLMLVDDVFSMVGRLATAPDPLFSRANSVSGAALSIVSWRRQEFVVADHVSRTLTSQPTAITFGIKHPRATFERLLTRPAAEIVHLSHPIPWPDDEDEWDTYATYVNDLAAEIRARDTITLIEAAAVDEYRFSRKREDRHAIRQRWPTASVPLLEAAASPPEAAFAAEPFDNAAHPDIKFDGDSDGNLDRLQDLLLETIHGRGRSLVVQSGGGVIGLRPFAARSGRRSTGVWIVSRLNHDLRCIERDGTGDADVQSGRARTVLVHPPVDEIRRKARACAEACGTALHLKGRDVVTGWTEDSPSKCASWLAANETEAGADGWITSWLRTDRAPRAVGEEIVRKIIDAGFAEFVGAQGARFATRVQALYKDIATRVRDALTEPSTTLDPENLTSRRTFGDVAWIDERPEPAALVDRILELRAAD